MLEAKLVPCWGRKSIKIQYKKALKNECGKKTRRKTIKILMPLGIDFWRILEDLGRQNGAKLAPKSHQKSIPTSKGDFLKKPHFSPGKTVILKVPEVEVGSKNRSKIDQELKSRWEGILASIFERFWWILGGFGSQVGEENRAKSDQKSILKNLKKS